MFKSYSEGHNYILQTKKKSVSINKYLFWFYLLLYYGIAEYYSSYGELTPAIALVCTLVGSIGISCFPHRLNNKKKSLKVHMLNLFYIFIAILMGLYIPPTARQLLSTPHSGGGTYFLKAWSMLVPMFLNLKFVAFKYFAHSVNEEIKA